MSHEPDDPAPMSGSLDRVLSSLGGGSAATLVLLARRWAEIAGVELAARARPSGLSEGVLLLMVDDPAWIPEVRFQAGSLVDRVNRALTEGRGVLSPDRHGDSDERLDAASRGQLMEAPPVRRIEVRTRPSGAHIRHTPLVG